MALIFPFFVSVDGAFCSDRQLFFAVIKLYGIKVLSIKIFFDKKEGIMLSLNGGKGKTISKKSNKKKKGGKNRNLLPLLGALYFTKIDLTLYAGGAPERVSLFLGALQVAVERFLAALPRIPDICRIEILPCYVNDQATAKFSIRFFTSLALFLYGFAHTTKEEKDAKRSDRKFDGQNNGRPEADG